MVWNMLKDNDFKYLGRNVDIVNGLQLIYQGILSFLKNGDNGRLLPVVRESSLWKAEIENKIKNKKYPNNLL